VSLRNLILLLVVVLALPALAQQPAGAPPPAPAGAPPLAVNGQPLPPGAVLGSNGEDVVVLATPYLRALGAQVRVMGGHLEAWWTGGILTLDAGSDGCSWNGIMSRLREPVGSMSGDLLVGAVEIGRIVGARVESGEWGLAISRSSAAPGAAGQESGQGRAGLPPGLSMIPSEMTGGLPPPQGLNPSSITEGRPFPDPTTGGLSEKQGLYESPYQRPEIGTEIPVEAVTPEPSPSPSPGYRPPRAVVSDLQARHIMTFHLTSYELRAKIRNEGTVALTRPFQVQLLARGARNSNFELLEAYLVRALEAGEEIELKKNADGHQFQSLQGTSVTFKAVVIEEAPPPQANAEARPGPATVEGSSRERKVSF